MPIENAAITGSISGPEIIAGNMYLAHTASTDMTGELAVIQVAAITDSAYQILDIETQKEFFILKDRVINMGDFNSNRHTYLIIEQL